MGDSHNLRDFDPYYTWLGVPPQERPISLYRLLGLTLFETNEAVIESAVEQRLAFLRTKTLGPHAVWAEKLMREIAQARIVLLDSQKKQAYDAELSATLKSSSSLPQLETSNGTDATGPWAATPQALELNLEVEPLERMRKQRQGARQRFVAIVVGSAILVGLVGLATFFFGRGDTSRTNEQARSGQPQVGAKASDGTIRKGVPQAAVEGPHHVEIKSKREDLPVAVEPVQVPSAKENPTDEQTPSSAGQGDISEPAPWPSLVNDQPMVAPPQNESRPENGEESSNLQLGDAWQSSLGGALGSDLPQQPLLSPPDARLEKQIEASLAEMFDLDKVGSAAEAKAKLQQLRTAADDPNLTGDQRFVLRKLAGRLALRAVELNVLWEMWAKLVTAYQCDGGEVIKELIAPERGDAYWVTRVTVESADIIAEVCRRGHPVEALAAVNALLESGRTTKPIRATVASWCLTEARSLLDQAIQWRREYDEGKNLLATDENDPAANRAVGRWLCLGADDWEEGLPYLARCGDPDLAELAKAELAGPPPTAAAFVALADRWWEYAAKADRTEQPYFRAHAKYLYEQAWLPRGTPLTALERARVEKLLSQPDARTARPLHKQIAAVLRGGPALTNKWIELGPLTRLGLAPQVGEVTLTPRGLAFMPASWVSLPFRSPGSYDVKAAFVRVNGDRATCLVLPAGPTWCELFVSGFGDRFHGIREIDGQFGDKNPSRRPAAKIPNGTLLTLEVAVRVEGPLCSIQAHLNRDPIVAWQGKVASLSLHAGWVRRPNALTFYANHSVMLHSISVRPLDDQAVLVFGQ